MDKKHISKIYHNGDTLYVKDAEARETMVSDVLYDTTNKKIVETINGVNSDVVSVSTIKSDLNLTKSDVSLSNVTNDAQVKRTEMGIASGVATLDSAGKVPASQLPSYVDDVVEYASRSAFPETGETGKIYVDIAANETYRWSGSQYVIISDSQVQANWNTTDATSKSYIQNKPTNVSSFTNDAGYLTLHQDISGKADKTATVSDVAYDSTNKKITKTINGTISDVVTVSTIKSDLNLSKSDVGLGDVVNTGDSAIPVSGGTTKFTTGGAYTELNKKVDKVTGKGLSTNDYTNDEKTKLNGIEAGAQKHIAPTASEVKTALGTGSGTTKYLREDGTWQTPEGGGATDITYDTTNKKITKTVNGVTSDVVTAAKIVEDGAKETVKISLTQIGGNAADLIGAIVTIKDDNTSEVIYSGTWNGSTIITQVNTSVHYTVSVGSVTGYMDCLDQSYYAGFGERTIEFQYRGNGVFIEDTNGILYTSSAWDNSKTANSVVVISDSFKRRMALSWSGNQIAPQGTSYNLTNHTTEADAKTDLNGKNNSTIMKATYDNGAVAFCTNFTFPDEKTKGYMPALGELWSIYQNNTEVNACLLACKGSGLPERTWTSTKRQTTSADQFWYIWMTSGSIGSHDEYISFGIIPIAEYE